jgi:hypothetical protein
MRFDLVRMTFGYCGIGNVHLHVHASQRIHPVSYPGIIGHRIRKVSDFTHDLPEDGGLFILCSDGVSSRVHPEEYAELSATRAVHELLGKLGKDHDDATALVVRLLP